MTRKQKRQRPAAGLEVVYADEQYSAVRITDPESGEQHIRVYSQPHHDLLFKVERSGLLFLCKRCRQEHLIRWHGSGLGDAPTCPLSRGFFSGENYLKAFMTHGSLQLIARLRDALTSKEGDGG